MKIRSLKWLALALLFVIGLLPLGMQVSAAAKPKKTTASKPAFLMPLYDASGADWSAACSGLHGTTSSFVIADIGNPGGPGTAKSSSWATNINYCGSAKVGVLGYVDTDFCQIPLATAEGQIDNWYKWYAGSGVDGIFFDEADSPTKPTATSDCLSGTKSATSYYQTLAAYVHAKASGQTVSYNFGVNPVSDWMLSGTVSQNADINVVFEDPYSDYVNYGGSGKAWAPAAWEANYSAQHFSALVYNGSDASQPAAFCSAATTQKLGYVYITPSNSWIALPPSSYLASELSAC